MEGVAHIGPFALTGEKVYDRENGYLQTITFGKNLQAIYPYALQGLAKVEPDWLDNIPEGTKLAYSDILTKSGNIWKRILESMAGQFRLDSESRGQKPLEPSSDGIDSWQKYWQDGHLGDANEEMETQLTKAARWVNSEQTEAEVEIQAAYAPKKQMDFVFVLDTGTPTADWYDTDTQDEKWRYPADGKVETSAQYAKVYEMASKVADVTGKLLDESNKQLDCRVAVTAFGDKNNFASQGSEKLTETGGMTDAGFYIKGEAEKAIEDLRWVKSEGSADYFQGMQDAFYFVRYARGLGREVTVIFLSDGEASGSETHWEKETLQKITDIKALGAKITGVQYSRDLDEGSEYIKEVCTDPQADLFLAEDTESFSQAVNKAVYAAANQYTLTDVVSASWFSPVADADIAVSGGTAQVGSDGYTIHWDLNGMEPGKTYSMTIRIKLKQQTDGTYPAGRMETNDGTAKLIPLGADEAVNEVQTPVLMRENEATPPTPVDPEEKPDPPDEGGESEGGGGSEGGGESEDSGGNDDSGSSDSSDSSDDSSSDSSSATGKPAASAAVPEKGGSPHPEINRLPIMRIEYGPGAAKPEMNSSAGGSQTAAAAKNAENAALPVIPELAAQYAANPELAGWLTLPGAGDGSPVMYTPDNWEYYLHYDLNREYSQVGIPFMGEGSVIGGDNTLIHGRSINKTTGFGNIWNYIYPAFHKEHPTLDYKTIYDSEGTYEVMAVFFAPVYPAEAEGVFKWYQYVGRLNEEQFDYYVGQAKASSLYDTGVTAAYGDKLVTLETCADDSTSQRLVVVARKKAAPAQTTAAVQP